MKRFLLLVAVLLVVSSSPRAFGTLSAVDDPAATGSWSQKFEEAFVGPFDQLQFQIMPVDGSTQNFKLPTAFVVFQGGLGLHELRMDLSNQWVQTQDTGTALVAHGPAVTWLQFYLHFDGDINQRVAMHFQAYEGTALKESVDAFYNGNGGAGGWSYERGTYNPGLSVVPEPASMEFFILGVLAMAGKIIRRK